MNQAQLIVGILIAALVAGVFVLMLRSWRRRVTRQSAIGSPDAPPEDAGAAFATLEGLHLGTTAAGKPLERIAVPPLGFRARGVLLIGPDGVELQLDGARPVFVPAGAIAAHSRASWTIDRGVEEDGLNLLAWSLHGTPVDSYFRMREPQAFDHAIQRLMSERSAA